MVKSQCFWCKDKFTSEHKCKNRQLYMITVQEKEKELEERGVDEDIVEEVKSFLEDSPHLSLSRPDPKVDT